MTAKRVKREAPATPDNPAPAVSQALGAYLEAQRNLDEREAELAFVLAADYATSPEQENQQDT